MGWNKFGDFIDLNPDPIRFHNIMWIRNQSIRIPITGTFDAVWSIWRVWRTRFRPPGTAAESLPGIRLHTPQYSHMSATRGVQVC